MGHLVMQLSYFLKRCYILPLQTQNNFLLPPMMALIIVMLTYLFFPSVVENASLVPRCSRILYTGLLFLLVKMSRGIKIKWYWKWFLYLVVPLLLLYVLGLVSGPVLAASTRVDPKFGIKERVVIWS